MRTMQKVTATEFKTRMGKYLETVLQLPISIIKSGRENAVLLSRQRYDELQNLEDRYWAEQAVEAEKNGYLGPEKSFEFLAKGMAQDDSTSS
ncbi:MAG: type II toxin-antitoxin system Phd/YefM family antitoxin [Magnetococcales bacterium]|nr:type II toxin-antitoxin system Phd/YefM family antitoxin [Magnetococcales bacterium]